MDLARICFDGFYNSIKGLVFSATKNNPEIAHDLFAWFCRTLYDANVGKFVLNDKYNGENLGFTLANGAGFNKNADIPPVIMGFLGFNRTIIGTVTGEEWGGNDRSQGYYGRQRIIRFVKTNSMVNWLGLPGIGAERVAEKLWTYRDSDIPITANLMATPDKKGDDALKDLEKVVFHLKHIKSIDRFELNISCPNTSQDRQEYQRQAREMVEAVYDAKNPWQELDVKLSPDLCERDIDDTLSGLDLSKIRAFTTTNSTTRYNPVYITETIEKGGASGDAVYADSLRVQKLVYEKTKGELELNASGGINSAERVRERLAFGAKEIQILTPLIFCGPELLRDIRKSFS